MGSFSRRRVLRGLLSGGAVTVGLPLLNCFLNGNGDALASGEKMPVRFGMWYWPHGMNAKVFVPKKTGTDFEFPEEIESLAPHRDKINLLTNGTAFLDNSPRMCHDSGWIIARTGMAPPTSTLLSETYDTKVANKISSSRRFKSLNVTAAADARISYTYADPNTQNPSEYSPLLFYTRIFGPEFPDPNAKEFKPNPRTMLRKSALSGVMGELKDFNQKIGAEDRVRLDQYLTGLRRLEQQFDQQLTKPEPIAACNPTNLSKDDVVLGNSSPLVQQRHQMMTDLLAMAVACDQTRVVNMAYAASFSNTLRPGYDKPHHTSTHEEGVDEKLGYQPNVSWFTRRSMESFGYFVSAFAKIKEGDGTLLDNMLIVADTEVGYARYHELERMALFTAGRAGGKIKTGVHVDMKGTSIARLGYTAMRTLGLDIATFGDRSNTTSSEIGEILV